MSGPPPDATHPKPQPTNYYTVLGLRHTASVQEIRRAYRDLSKLYHPDTTELSPDVATAKFHTLNEAYATLSSPERRAAYDLKHGYSCVSVIQTPANFNRPVSEARRYRSNAYLDPSDRPLSAGELFALFILGVTFVACLVLVLAVGVSRGEFTIASLKSERLIEIIHHATDRPPAAMPSEELVESSQAVASDGVME